MARPEIKERQQAKNLIGYQISVDKDALRRFKAACILEKENMAAVLQRRMIEYADAVLGPEQKERKP